MCCQPSNWTLNRCLHDALALEFTQDKTMEGGWQGKSERVSAEGKAYLSCKQGQDASATPNVQNYLPLDEM